MTLRIANALWGFLFFLVVIGFGIAVLLFAFNGCCHNCPCPPPYPVIVNKACPLPPAVELPPATPLMKCSGGEFLCFDTLAAKQLALREIRLKQWIREVRAACTPASSQPATSQPK